MEKFIDAARKFILLWNGVQQYQVKYLYGEFVLDMENQTCACRRWQLSGLPCSNAISILDKGHNVEDYVSEWFKLETYMTTYENVINPINGIDLWLEFGQLPLLPPPWYVANKRTNKEKKRT